MTSHLNDGDCVVQILACEQGSHRLFEDISKHVAAGRAKQAAVYEARVVIEAPNTGSRPQQDVPTRLPIRLPSVYLGRNDLTLTLLHIDTTFRFTGACVNNSSPGLAWPEIHQSFTTRAFVDNDLVLRAQHHHPDASHKPGKRIVTTSESSSTLTTPRDIAPGALLLHVEILASANADALLLKMAGLFRAIRCLWSRQLLFSQDPARFRKTPDGILSVLMQEFDPQQSAETIITQLNGTSLRHALDLHQAEISIRLFGLIGTSHQRLRIPMDPADLPIQNCLYSESVNEDSHTES